jgi:hypothetical protein
MKLSPAQERALGKLTGEWRSAWSLRESMSTLDSLVSKGLAHHKGTPHHDIHYRRRINCYRLKDGGQ